MENKKIIAKAISLGAKAGLRGMVAPALVGYFLDYQTDNLFGKSKSGNKNTVISKVLSGKGKQFPLNPNRRMLTPRSLSRVASGAMAGASLFRANKGGVVKGLLLGGASALAVTVASHYLQEYLHKQSKSKDPLLSAVGLLINAGNHFLNKKK